MNESRLNEKFLESLVWEFPYIINSGVTCLFRLSGVLAVVSPSDFGGVYIYAFGVITSRFVIESLLHSESLVTNL